MQLQRWWPMELSGDARDAHIRQSLSRFLRNAKIALCHYAIDDWRERFSKNLRVISFNERVKRLLDWIGVISMEKGHS